MSDRELEIFELSLTLIEALSGDKEAVADLTKLVSNHPELFTNTEDVSRLIKEVLKSPNLIAKNHRAKQDGDLLVAKKSLQETPHKMGDIGIRNDNGTNVIYHALKQDSRQFDRLLRRANKLGLLVGASLSHTSRPAELDADEANAKSSSVKTHSITHNETIPQKGKMEANGGDALSLHTPSQARMGANVVSSTLSSASGGIVAQNTHQTTNNKKIFSKNPKPTQETRDRLQTKMREVASKDKESKHAKNKGDCENERN